jgi:hypothetical protein
MTPSTETTRPDENKLDKAETTTELLTGTKTNPEHNQLASDKSIASFGNAYQRRPKDGNDDVKKKLLPRKQQPIILTSQECNSNSAKRN